MDYRDDHLRRVSAEKRLACPHKVEPAMDAGIVFDAAAPLPEAGERVMIRMCHDRPLKAMTVFFDVGESRVKLKLVVRSVTLM